MSKSNLGGYQTIIEWANKVKGPFNLLAITGVIGYGTLRLAEAGIKKYRDTRKLKKEPKEYVFTKNGSHGALKFESGDRFVVITITDSGALIDVPDDKHAPYFVSVSFLKEYSNYS